MRTALVFAGGGVGVIAWELGVLRGLADADPQLAQRVLDADTVIGTSAGSTVAAQVTSGVPLGDLYEAQLSPDTAELEAELDLAGFTSRFDAAIAGAADATDRRRRVGAFALAAFTIPESKRRAVVAARLPTPDWPARDLRIPAVDAVTGDVVVFTPSSGGTLVDAVAASCAVPGVWPPATIGGRRYVDGGVRSSTNVDLAAGADRTLVITPNVAGAPSTWMGRAVPTDPPADAGDLTTELAALSGSRVEVIYADQSSTVALGRNPLAVNTRGPAALAGRTVGRNAAARVARLLDSP